MAPLPNTSDPGGICCPRRSIAKRWGIDSRVGPKLQVRSGPLNGWVGPGKGTRLPDERLSLNTLTKPVIVLHERHLKRLLIAYFEYYHHWRTHRALDMDGPVPRPVQRPELGLIREVPEVGGLHYH